MDKGELYVLFDKLISKFGSQKEFAKFLGISPQYLNDILQYHREPRERILEPLGITEIVRYSVVSPEKLKKAMKDG